MADLALQSPRLASKIRLRMDASQGRGRKLSRIGFLLAIIAGVLILSDLNRRMTDARQLEQDAEVLRTEVASLEVQNVRLQTEIAEATSEARVERWARSEAKMVRPGEVLVFPVPISGRKQAGEPTPTPGEDLPSNWEVWWALLFGG